MAYLDQQMSSSKIVSIGIVIVVHIFLGYALVTGLAFEAAKKVAKTLDVVDIEEEAPPEEEIPPEPEKIVEPPVVAPPPIVRTVTPPPTVTIAPPPPVVVPRPVAPPPPPPPPVQAKAAVPKGQARWAARIQEQYPARAFREEREGRVSVRLTIGTDGKVLGCAVTGSSGHADLDTAACEGLTRYARFDPAIDTAGNPSNGNYNTAIRYQINR